MKRSLAAAFPFLLFAGLALVITSPLFCTPSRLRFPVAASHWDAADPRWTAWWVGEALSRGESFLQCELLFYPFEESLDLFPANWSYSLLLQPIVWIFGVPEGLNLHYATALLLSFTAAGFFAYLLAREVGLSRMAACFAGVAFAVCGIRMCNVARTNVVVSEFLPLLLWFYLRVVRRPNAPHVIGLGIAAALTFYGSLEITNQALLMLAGWFVVSLIVPATRRATVRAIPLLAAAGIVVGILGAPLIVRLIVSGSGSAFAARAASYLPVGSLDLLAPFVPHAGDALYGKWLGARPPVHFEIEALREGATAASFFLGFGVPALAILALVTGKWRRALPWMALGLVFLVLSMGPLLKVGGTVTHVWLPYAYLYKIFPPIQLSRVPLRLLSAASLGLALWAAWGFEGLRERLTRRRVASLVMTVVAFGIVLLESAERIPIDMMPSAIRIPDSYRAIGEDPQARSLLELPYNRYELNRLTLYYQTVHRLPIYFCDYPRAEHQMRDDLHALPFFGYVFAVQNAATYAKAQPGRFKMPEPPRDLEAVQRTLRDWGLRYVTLHEIPWPDGRIGLWSAVVALRDALRRLGPVAEWEEEAEPGYAIRFFRMF
ncbi:MAG: hypothetical protein AB1486_01225 [Planctomycetota bacterium]